MWTEKTQYTREDNGSRADVQASNVGRESGGNEQRTESRSTARKKATSCQSLGLGVERVEWWQPFEQLRMNESPHLGSTAAVHWPSEQRACRAWRPVIRSSVGESGRPDSERALLKCAQLTEMSVLVLKRDRWGVRTRRDPIQLVVAVSLDALSQRLRMAQRILPVWLRQPCALSEKFKRTHAHLPWPWPQSNAMERALTWLHSLTLSPTTTRSQALGSQASGARAALSEPFCTESLSNILPLQGDGGDDDGDPNRIQCTYINGGPPCMG